MICKKKHGVIFDLDGVLIDSSKSVENAYKYSLNKVSLTEIDAPFSEYKKHMGKSFLKIMEIMGLPAEMHRHFTEKSIELGSEISLFDGVIDLLETLRINNCYIGIATGKDSFRTNLILQDKNILHYFDKVLCSDQLEYGKPHAEAMKMHMCNSDIANTNFIFVGDSIADIQCARNSQVRSIAALWGFGKQEDLIQQNPDYLATDLYDLKHILTQSGFIQLHLRE